MAWPLINHHHLQGLRLLARSVLKHEASLRIMGKPFLIEQVTSLLQNPLSWSTRFSFPQTGCLLWVNSSVWPPRNHGIWHSAGATHRGRGTWSSRKAGSPLPVVGLSLVRVPIFFNRIVWGEVKSKWVHSARRPPIGLLYLSRLIMRMENFVELWLAGEPKVLGENLP
jgi:hypothetical protein